MSDKKGTPTWLWIVLALAGVGIVTVCVMSLAGVGFFVLSPGGPSGAREQGARQTGDTSTGGGQAQEVIPTPRVGETVSSGEVEVFIPPEAQGPAPEITIEPVNEPVPPPPEGINAVGKVYDIIAEQEPDEPVLITLSYDPADLPPGTLEENLYLATLVGDTWEPVPDGFVDTHNHTVSASVEHFSWYGIFENPVEALYSAVEALVGDEISSEYFGDLPDDIRHDIYDEQIRPQDVTAVVHAKLSLATRAASAVISFADAVSKTAGTAIAALDEAEGAVYEAMALAVAGEAFEMGEVEEGSFALLLYDSASLGRDIGTYLADTTEGDPYTLAAKGAAWLLAVEMDYINANMDQAFADIWTFNPTSTSRLQVYAVYVDGPPWDGVPGAKGVKFYYYDEGQDRWINYYDNMVYWTVEFEPAEQVAEQPTDAPAPTKTPRPTSTTRPTNTPVPTYTPEPTATPEPKFDLEITLSWSDARDDLDLILWVPDYGDMFTWQNSPSSMGAVHSGESSDIEVGRTCKLGNTLNTESIYWPNHDAPAGEYTVQVDYYEGTCGLTWEQLEDRKVEYEVEVRVDGEVIERFTGRLAWLENAYHSFTLGN
jgi:hypothetical protein